MRLLSSTLLIALAACSGDVVAPPAGPDPEHPGSIWVQQAQTDEAMRANAAQRETMRYVNAGGSIDYATTIGGNPVTLTFDVELAAFQVADVPTLEHPIGFVKLGTLSLKSTNSAWDKLLVDSVFRRNGSPIQLTFESHSIGDMQGRLTGLGTHASGRAVGNMQVDDRQVDLTLNVTVDRLTETTLTVHVLPSEVDVSTLGLDSYLTTAGKAVGGAISRKGMLSGTLELKRFDGGQMPTFARTPVTVQTVAEVVRKLDAEHTDLEAAKLRLVKAGVDQEMVEGLNDEMLQSMVEMRKKYDREAAKAKRGADLGER